MTFTVRHGFSMALIEIDGLPTVLKNERIFHGELLVITRWEWWFSTGWNQQGICPWKLTWPAQQFRRSRRGWCGVLKGITGIIHSCTTNPPWINPKKIPINPPNHHQLSSRYIYIVLTPLLDHSNYIPWLMTIRVKMAPENPMVPPKLIQQTVGFTSICVL